MCHGVSKSGSPTPRDMTSFDCATMSKNRRIPLLGSLATCGATLERASPILAEAYPVYYAVEMLAPGEDLYRDAQVEALHRRSLEAREPDGVLLGGDERVRAHVGSAVEGVEDFGGVVAVVVCVAFAPHHLRAKGAQLVLEALGAGDAGKRAACLAVEPRKRELLAAPHVLQGARRVAALDDLRRLVQPAHFLAHGAHVAAAFRKKDYVGPLDVPRGLAKDAARQHVAVPERVCRVDEHDLDRVLQALVLEAVVEDERVAAEPLDGVAPRLHAVAVDDYGNAGEVRSEHVRLVAACRGIKEHMTAVGDDKRRLHYLREHAPVPRRLLAPVAAREDGNLAPFRGERAREQLRDGRLAGAARGDIADRDYLYAEREPAQDARLVEEVPYRDGSGEEPAQEPQEAQQQPHPRRMAEIGARLLDKPHEPVLETLEPALPRLAHGELPERIARGGPKRAKIDEEAEAEVVLVDAAVYALVFLLVGEREPEAEAVGAQVYPCADFGKLSLVEVPHDERREGKRVAHIVFEADLAELLPRMVEHVLAHKLGGVRHDGIVPDAVVAAVVVDMP